MAKTEFWLLKKLRRSSHVSENQQALNHVVSMEDLTVDQLKLIKRGIEFKRIVFLREQTYRIRSLLWRFYYVYKSLWVAETGWNDLTLMWRLVRSMVRHFANYHLDPICSRVNVCVIRHPEVDYYRELIASPSITTSIINGGDETSGQHLARALDLMTIYEEFGHFRVSRLRAPRVAKSNI